MIELPPLLVEALSAIGADIEARMGDLISDFVAIPLSEEDRLSALAGAVATIATTRYRRHRAIFIAALRSWALEISMALAPPAPRIVLEGRRGPAGEAQDGLLNGLDAILHAMLDDGSAKHHRLVTELAVMARLLGQYDTRTHPSCSDRGGPRLRGSALVLRRMPCRSRCAKADCRSGAMPVWRRSRRAARPSFSSAAPRPAIWSC